MKDFDIIVFDLIVGDITFEDREEETSSEGPFDVVHNPELVL
jgi:hypothetical protein